MWVYHNQTTKKQNYAEKLESNQRKTIQENNSDDYFVPIPLVSFKPEGGMKNTRSGKYLYT